MLGFFLTKFIVLNFLRLNIFNSLTKTRIFVVFEFFTFDPLSIKRLFTSKTKIEKNFSGKLEDCDMWSFDGSSTEQALGGSSDCLLKPVFICKDPGRKDAYLVMCEVLNADGTDDNGNNGDRQQTLWTMGETCSYAVAGCFRLPQGQMIVHKKLSVSMVKKVEGRLTQIVNLPK